MKKIAAIVLTVLCLLPLLTACEKTESQMGIFYDPIVCRFSYSGSYGGAYGNYGIVFTVYSDNRIKVSSGVKDEVTGELVSSVYSPITEEQKQRIIDRIREYQVWNIECDSETIVFDAVVEYIHLFDASGEEVCGLYCFDSKRTRVDEIHKIGELIAGMVPWEIRYEMSV